MVTWDKDSRNQYKDDGVNIYYELEIVGNTTVTVNTKDLTNARKYTISPIIGAIQSVKIRKINDNFQMIGS